MATADNLASLLAPAARSDFSVHQGFMTAWNGTTSANTVDVEGATLTNLPVISTAGLGANILVLILRVRTTYYILGKITTP